MSQVTFFPSGHCLPASSPCLTTSPSPQVASTTVPSTTAASVGGGEPPVEGAGGGVVTVLEPLEPVGQLAQVGEVGRADDLALMTENTISLSLSHEACTGRWTRSRRSRGAIAAGALHLAACARRVRRCDVLGLRLADLRPGERRVFVAEGKAGHSRIVPISSGFFTTLAAYLTDERPRTDRDELFVVLKGRRRGAPLSAAGILRGYLEGGGSLSSPAVVSAAPAALVSWVVENLFSCIEFGSNGSDRKFLASLPQLLCAGGHIAWLSVDTDGKRRQGHDTHEPSSESDTRIVRSRWNRA